MKNDWLNAPAVRGSIAMGAVVLLALVTTFAAQRYAGEREARAVRAAAEGREHLARGDWRDALERFREVVALRPHETGDRLDLALALTNLGRTDEARSHLGDILERDPVNGLANLLMARALARGHLTDEAGTYYYRAIYGRWPPEATDSRVAARLELAGFIEQTADQETLRGELVRLAAAFPDDIQLQLDIGRSLLDRGYPSDAAVIYEGVTDRSPDRADAFAGLAHARLEAGRFADVVAAARQALALVPDDEATAARLETARAVLALDPTLPRLSMRERTRRSRLLVETIREQLAACLTRGDRALAADEKALLTEARTWLARGTRSPDEDPIDRGLAIAEGLWQARQRACPDVTETSDETMRLVLQRVAQPEAMP
jgi:tetratricopeptide (TPR) repeat protein